MAVYLRGVVYCNGVLNLTGFKSEGVGLSKYIKDVFTNAKVYMNPNRVENILNKIAEKNLTNSLEPGLILKEILKDLYPGILISSTTSLPLASERLKGITTGLKPLASTARDIIGGCHCTGDALPNKLYLLEYLIPLKYYEGGIIDNTSIFANLANNTLQGEDSFSIYNHQLSFLVMQDDSPFLEENALDSYLGTFSLLKDNPIVPDKNTSLKITVKGNILRYLRDTICNLKGHSSDGFIRLCPNGQTASKIYDENSLLEILYKFGERLSSNSNRSSIISMIFDILESTLNNNRSPYGTSINILSPKDIDFELSYELNSPSGIYEGNLFYLGMPNSNLDPDARNHYTVEIGYSYRK
jgi:hypothetical protein